MYASHYGIGTSNEQVNEIRHFYITHLYMYIYYTHAELILHVNFTMLIWLFQLNTCNVLGVIVSLIYAFVFLEKWLKLVVMAH